MSIYAIGDVQGCYDSLRRLLDKIQFSPENDQLWFVGDLVNRGTKSLKTVRFIKSLGDSSQTVLGNHDISLIAMHYGVIQKSPSLKKFLKSKHREELIDWLRHQKVFHVDKKLGVCMAHAGISPQWTLKEAKQYAKEIQIPLRGNDTKEWIKQVYGNKPNIWSDDLQSYDRHRYILNAFTRMRYCNVKDGSLDFKLKCAIAEMLKESYEAMHETCRDDFLKRVEKKHVDYFSPTQNALVARANIDLLIPLINVKGGIASYKGKLEGLPIEKHIEKLRNKAASNKAKTIFKNKPFQGSFLRRSAFLGAMLFGTISAPVSAETLLQVYEHAKQNDAQLKISEMGFLAALEAKPQVLSGLKPQVTFSAGANYGMQYKGKRSFGGESTDAFLSLGYDLNLSKVIINKQLDAQIDQVDSSILQSKALLEADRQDLIIRVAEAYFSYLNANDTLAFRKSEKNAIGKQLNQVKAFFDAGRSAITDVKEAQASYDLAVAQIEVANQQIDVSRESLRAITTRYYKHLNGAADSCSTFWLRSEALKRSRDVSLCASNDQTTCNGGTDYSDGWIVYADCDGNDALTAGPVDCNDDSVLDEEEIIKVHNGFEKIFINSGSNNITFLFSGRIANATTFNLGHESDSATVKQVVINRVGRIRSQ
ncbi:Bis(5'-nucleosyl)-tetraphosphatase, symmetrical [Nymphon striatum]|nr:Bis(5'-nucleosyl)-tetraphosphatase, symmetrical [Nymphon striatum]